MAIVRRIFFWTHLIFGVGAGIVIFIMSFTGAAIALQPQVLLWVEREMRTVPASPGARWIGPEALLAKVREQRPDLTPASLTLEHDPTLAVTVTLTSPRPEAPGEARPTGAGRPAPPPPQTTLYVNPYTGDVLGQLDASSPARRFFRVNTDWHRWLAMSGDQRAAGRWITGVANAAFLVLALTGLYIWIPRMWSWTAVRAVTLFRTGLPSKARDFNWHNVIGVWSAAVLVVLTFTGMCISFPKTYDVIYAVTGIERPPLAAAPSPPGASVVVSLEELDEAWGRAEAQMPSWRSIAMRLPQRAGQPLTFTFNDREQINPMARSTLTVDTATADVVRWEPYKGLTTGQRLRTWMRFGHTGELWGLPGQIVAGLASAGGCVLVYTGVSLACRRFLLWRARGRRRLIRTDVRERSAA